MLRQMDLLCVLHTGMQKLQYCLNLLRCNGGMNTASCTNRLIIFIYSTAILKQAESTSIIILKQYYY